MNRSATLGLALLLALPLTALAEDENAKATAQEVLDKGAALFDMRDAAGLAATYTDDAQVHWIQKGDSPGAMKEDRRKGRDEIEALYREVFNALKDPSTSKNTVEFARLVTPDLLVIHGTFKPLADKSEKFPFVQVRVQKDGKWLIKTLELFLFSED